MSISNRQKTDVKVGVLTIFLLFNDLQVFNFFHFEKCYLNHIQSDWSSEDVSHSHKQCTINRINRIKRFASFLEATFLIVLINILLRNHIIFILNRNIVAVASLVTWLFELSFLIQLICSYVIPDVLEISR